MDISQYFRVCLPVPLPLPQAIPPNRSTADQHPVDDTMARSSPPPVYRPNDAPATQPPEPSTPAPPPEPSTPAPPPEPSTPAPPPEPSTHVQSQEHNGERTAQGESRRSSASSSSSQDSLFSHWSITTQFLADLRAVEASYTTQELPPTSSPPPAPTSSPPTESQPAQPDTDESPPMRRWVVFRGRVPGIYTSSADATAQTGGFPNAFMLAFDDLTTVANAYERFQDDGTIPTHSYGPWVVFIGRQPGVFTSYEDLRASVVGFSNNCYRSCESIEEGYQALSAFQARLAAGSSSPATTGPAPAEHHSSPTPTDDSWWCCFAGAEPRVYNGLARLNQASPAPGGVRCVKSEKDGWEMWTMYFNAGEVHVVQSA